MEYIKKVACKCYNCHAISMEKIIVDSERIKLDAPEIVEEKRASRTNPKSSLNGDKNIHINNYLKC